MYVSTTYYNETKKKYSQKVKRDVRDLMRHNYFLLCNNCLWMASMLSNFPSKYLGDYKHCPICFNKMNRFLICEPAN